MHSRVNLLAGCPRSLVLRYDNMPLASHLRPADLPWASSDRCVKTQPSGAGAVAMAVSFIHLASSMQVCTRTVTGGLIDCIGKPRVSTKPFFLIAAAISGGTVAFLRTVTSHSPILTGVLCRRRSAAPDQKAHNHCRQTHVVLVNYSCSVAPYPDSRPNSSIVVDNRPSSSLSQNGNCIETRMFAEVGGGRIRLYSMAPFRLC